MNIFNKRSVNAEDIYMKILNNKDDDVTDDEIELLNDEISIHPVRTPEELNDIIKFYSKKYATSSLNWLDVSHIEYMYGMFSYTTYNGDISEWNVSNVNNMMYMFDNSSFDKDISRWNVSNVWNMHAMFNRSVFNGDISQWNVSNVKQMGWMFTSSLFNGNISDWDVSNVNDMESMF